MFIKEKHRSSDTPFSHTATLINRGTTFKGDVSCDNDLRIDGTVLGNVSGKAKVIIGASGVVEGNIDGKQADITGKVTGNIMVQDMLFLRNKSQVHGNVGASTLQADTGALFNGFCHMGGGASIVLMKEQDVHAKAQ
jgi:cytoskeletal protein CcmA (bactofilin family)